MMTAVIGVLRSNIVRYGKAVAGLAVPLLLLGCSTPAGEPSAPDAELAPDSGITSPSPEAAVQPTTDAAPNKPQADQKVPEQAVGCGSSPLQLTRFDKSLRTTAEGRTFTGWGGTATPAAAKRQPILFIHGNGGDADGYLPFRNIFCKAGYSDAELWAVTFQNNTCSGYCSNGSNTQHATELAKFVELVRAQTGATRVAIVAVSMGVPTARYYIKYLGGLQKSEVSLAYLVSGPNHGLEACDAYSAGSVNVSCAELDATALASGWLKKLNTPDETPNGQDNGLPKAQTIIYRTVAYQSDPFFPGKYVKSPELVGADNQMLPGDTHAAIDTTDLLSYLNKAAQP